MGAIIALAVLLGTFPYGHCVELTQPASVVIKPGQPLSVSCKVSYSLSSYHTQWIRQPAGKALEWIGIIHTDGSTAYKDSLKSKFTISRDTSSNTVFLRGSSLQTGDTAVYYCARGNGNYFDYWGQGTKVTVSSGEKTPPLNVFPLVSCGSGTSDYVTIGCIAKDFMPDSLTFKWSHKGGAALADTDILQYPSVQDGGKFTAFSHAKVKATEWDKKQVYQCSAEYDGTSKKADVVKADPPPPQQALLYLMTPSQDELKHNKTATFACFASEFFPEKHSFTWRRKGKEMTSGITTLPAVEGKAGDSRVYSATSFLRISESQWTEIDSPVSCEFKHSAANVERTAHNSIAACITENPVIVTIIPPPSVELFLKNRVELKCNVTGKPENIDSVDWQKEDGTSLVTTTETIGDSKIYKLYIPYENWANGTMYKCIVKHFDSPDPIERIYRRENGPERQPPSVFVTTTAEKTNSDKVTLICYAKEFYPKEVLFSWHADDRPVNRTMFQSTQVLNTGSTYSAYSQLSISAAAWKSGVMYTCTVHHEAAFDGTTRTIVRTIDSVSKMSTTISLDLGRPASLDSGPCKA